jgi:hypothetical protein
MLVHHFVVFEFKLWFEFVVWMCLKNKKKPFPFNSPYLFPFWPSAGRSPLPAPRPSQLSSPAQPAHLPPPPRARLLLTGGPTRHPPPLAATPLPASDRAGGRVRLGVRACAASRPRARTPGTPREPLLKAPPAPPFASPCARTLGPAAADANPSAVAVAPRRRRLPTVVGILGRFARRWGEGPWCLFAL